MRLHVLDNGHRLRARVFLRVMGSDAPDVPRMLLYRPDFLARPLLAITVRAMRGPSYWTVAEREFVAMTVAKRNECPYCRLTHAEIIHIAGHGEVTPDDPDSPRPELRSAIAFLDALRIGGSEAPAFPAPPPSQALGDVLEVMLVWDIVNRLANAFGFGLRGDQLRTATRTLHRFGYRFPGFLLTGGGNFPSGDPVAQLRFAVFESTATMAPALRSAAASGDELAEPWQSYTALVRDASHKITDAEIDRLLSNGHSEDAVFEMTVAAAVGAALRTFDAGRRVLGTLV